MSYYDSPEFRRQANAATDNIVKLFFRVLSSIFMALVNAIRAMVNQVLGK